MKKSTPLSAVASADVSVFDAEDYDNFKLPGDNVATGDNVFSGHTSISSLDAVSVHAAQLSTELSSVFLSGCTATAQDVVDAIYDEIRSTSNDINGISSAVSSHCTTLSAIDRANDEYGDISTDNLVVTQAGTTTGPDGQHTFHDMYYMTMLSGTVVMKKLQH